MLCEHFIFEDCPRKEQKKKSLYPSGVSWGVFGAYSLARLRAVVMVYVVLYIHPKLPIKWYQHGCDCISTAHILSLQAAMWSSPVGIQDGWRPRLRR